MDVPVATVEDEDDDDDDVSAAAEAAFNVVTVDNVSCVDNADIDTVVVVDDANDDKG